MNKIKTFLKWLGNKINSFIQKTGEFFRRKKPNEKEPAYTNTDKSGLDEDQYYDDYFNKINGLDDVMVKLGLYKRISACHKYMYEMGRRDGAVGVTVSNIVNIARATAQEMFGHIYVLLTGKLASLKGEFEAAKRITENDEELHRREQSYYDYVKYLYRFFPKSHSLFLFVLYLIVSVTLILADIPLAVILIQKGFDLPEANDDLFKFRHLLDGDFWMVIAQNWETVFTALGIALCTIYIKIFYDEFVGTPYANKLMTFRKFVSENQSTEEKIDPTLEKKVMGEHNEKKALKITLLLITMLSIISLAFFRLETAHADSEQTVSFAKKAAFIAITILFPVIGGICLSYSLNNIQNRVRLWKAKGACNSSRKKWTDSLKLLAAEEKNYNDLNAAYSRLSDEHRMIQEYTDYLLAFYQRGYAIGSMQPEKYAKGEDFFNKILEWRNIAISRKINNHISGLSQLNNIMKSIIIVALIPTFVSCNNGTASESSNPANEKGPVKEVKSKTAYILCDFSVSQDRETVKKIVSNAEEIFYLTKNLNYNLKFYNISAPQHAGPFFEFKKTAMPSISKPSEQKKMNKLLEEEFNTYRDSLHNVLSQLSQKQDYKVTCIIRTFEQVVHSLIRTVKNPATENVKIIILSDLLEDCSYPEGKVNIDGGTFESARIALSKMPQPKYTLSEFKKIEVILVASSQRNWNTNKGEDFWDAALLRFGYKTNKPIGTDLPTL